MSKPKHIHMVGIKGVGMTALALMYVDLGYRVTGSDVSETFVTDETLRKAHIRPKLFSIDNITESIDELVTTGAHGGLNNPEVKEAQLLHIPVKTHAEALGEVMNLFETRISVCGTHGKTTTSGMIAYVLARAKAQAGWHVGASDISGMKPGAYVGPEIFVAEADEYVADKDQKRIPRFMFQKPNIIVATNIEFDHPDVFNNVEEIATFFEQFICSLPVDGTYIYNSSDERLTNISKVAKCRVISYGFSDSDVLIKELGDGSFTISTLDTPITLAIPGKHNILNASAAIIALQQAGIHNDKIVKHIPTFKGAARRFEIKYEDEKNILIDDYAHHPSELRSLVEGARSKYPDYELCLIFQPHTFSRTRALLDDFIDTLAQSDHAYVTDIYTSAREKDGSISARDIQKKAEEKGIHNVKYLPIEDIAQCIHWKPSKTLYVTAGAGDIYKTHQELINKLSS